MCTPSLRSIAQAGRPDPQAPGKGPGNRWRGGTGDEPDASLKERVGI